jgi:hypothetical protein
MLLPQKQHTDDGGGFAEKLLDDGKTSQKVETPTRLPLACDQFIDISLVQNLFPQ